MTDLQDWYDRPLKPGAYPQPTPLLEFEADYEREYGPTPTATRGELLVSAWRKRKLPPRDYLSGEVLCTTSRALLIGPTGIGKTLFALDWVAAMAAGADFLGWEGRRRTRVMYLDGELPAETFKERMELIGDRYGDDIELFGYSRDVLSPDEMPPLNTDAGRAWLWREIEIVKPDLISFDAIMCLLSGNMSEEESWAPVKDLMRKISAKRIAQLWLHHTGHDTTKGYGTKTREWELDIVIMLSKLESEGDEPDPSAAFQLEFTKSRAKTPRNYLQFSPRTVRATEAGFVAEDGGPAKPKAKGEIATLMKAFAAAYDRLADGVEKSAGFDGAQVIKVKVDAVRDEMKSRGYLDKDEKGRVTAASRKAFGRAKMALLEAKRFVEAEGLIWR